MRLEWDKNGEREYQSGVSKVVLFPQNSDSTYEAGVAWNGATKVSDNSEGGEANPVWGDNQKYAVLYSPDDPKGKISAWMYPDEFEDCLGNVSPAPGAVMHGQAHKPFGLCYRTEIGSDSNPDKGYILHFIYGAVAQTGDVEFETQDDDPEPVEFEFDFDCTPVPVTGYKRPTAHFEVKSTTTTAAKMEAIENLVYGSANAESQLPLPDELITLLNAD